MTMLNRAHRCLPASRRPTSRCRRWTERDTVSLADYRGRSPVFLALLLGLWCPFCRRPIAQMGATEGKLKAIGVETLGVVATAAGERPALLQVPPDPPAAGRRPGAHHAPRVSACRSRTRPRSS